MHSAGDEDSKDSTPAVDIAIIVVAAIIVAVTVPVPWLSDIITAAYEFNHPSNCPVR